jgi:hypothetical protein
MRVRHLHRMNYLQEVKKLSAWLAPSCLKTQPKNLQILRKTADGLAYALSIVEKYR